MQQRLVVPRLELVRTDQEPVGVLTEQLFDLDRRKAVDRYLADLRSTVIVFARERDKGLMRTLPLFQIVTNGMIVLDRPLDAGVLVGGVSVDGRCYFTVAQLMAS